MSEQGITLAAFAQQQLDAELARRAALDTRSTAIVTSAAVLTTLTVTLGVWTAKNAGHVTAPRAIGAAAVLAFLGAAILAIVANRARYYKVVEDSEVMDMLREQWDVSETTARSMTAQYNTLTMSSLRQGNNKKASLIEAAQWVQLGGLSLASLAVGVGLFT